VSASTIIPIVDGGNKLELFEQLLDIGRRLKDNGPDFRIVVQHPRLKGKSVQHKLDVSILGIGAEDGSGNSWMINGDIWRKELEKMPSWLRDYLDPDQNAFHSHFRGYYNSRQRSGFIELEHK
jgi:ketopantoate hydroxymethyltransferase